MKRADEKKVRAPREKRIVDAAETADIAFRETLRVSEYRELLESLQDAQKGSTLAIHKSARYTAVKHIRELGLKVLWGRKGDILYIKIVGEAAAAPKLDAVQAVKEASQPVAVRQLEDLSILRAFSEGPLTLKEASKALGLAPSVMAGKLSSLVGRKLLECEDGVYRRPVK